MTDPMSTAVPADQPAPPTRWGIVATGAIAAQIAADLDHVPGARKVAVASRDLARARVFATEHGIERAYGSHAELFADDEVDVVYVATPHAHHHAVASEAIAAGKPLLVEKAFTCSAAATNDLVAQARAAGVFVMEAMWLRFQPGLVRLKQLVDSGAIGEIRAVHADLGFPSQAPATHRLLDPRQGGGALLDCGVYVVSFAQWLLGAATSIAVTGRLGPTGVDVEAGLLLGYPGERHAVLSCSLASASPGQAAVVGTEGRIIVPPRFHHPATIRLERLGHAPEVIDNPLTGHGYAHELEHVARCLAAGDRESSVMPLGDTVEVMRVLDHALQALGAPHVDAGFGE